MAPFEVDLTNVNTDVKVGGIKKKCTSCGSILPIEDFGSNSTSSDGRQSYCRVCRNDLHKERRTIDIDRRIRHHFCTRITYQLRLAKVPVPEALFNNLETYLGYKIWLLKAKLHTEVQASYGISLREAIVERGFHIDHLRPLSSFVITDIACLAFRECWAISNLKAIPAADNLAKGAKFDWDEEQPNHAA